jgi:hypothetical protein
MVMVKKKSSPFTYSMGYGEKSTLHIKYRKLEQCLFIKDGANILILLPYLICINNILCKKKRVVYGNENRAIKSQLN